MQIIKAANGLPCKRPVHERFNADRLQILRKGKQGHDKLQWKAWDAGEQRSGRANLQNVVNMQSTSNPQAPLVRRQSESHCDLISSAIWAAALACYH